MNDVQTVQTLGLNENWLDTTTGQDVNLCQQSNTGDWEYTTWTYPIYGNTCTTYSWSSKIRLKLSEVLYLRKQARKDKKLQKILRKFGSHIEIEVDF